MKKHYGNFGMDDLDASKAISSQVLENPLLDAGKNASEVDLKSDWNTPSTDCSPTKPVIRGPTDKQIESLTKDGRRRITPVFIPLSSSFDPP